MRTDRGARQRRRRRVRAATAVALVAGGALVGVLVGAEPGGRQPGPGAPLRPDQALVVRVVDGDTVRLAVGDGEESVRLIGIDTPESVDPRRHVECFGREAAAFTRSLLPVGTVVRLERDVELRDRFGRLLAYLYRAEDELFVNEALAAQGYAQVLTVPPNVAHQERFRAAVAQARASGAGLWSACPGEGGDSVPP